jgi:hypothetical protein
MEGAVTMNRSLSVQMLTRTALFLGLTLAVQAFRFPPLITGPLVNFMLIMSVMLLGTTSGMLISFVTPWVALAVGILPSPLATAVPFIMAGNMLYCLMVGVFPRTAGLRSLGVVLGSVVKFAVIGGAATYVLALPVPIAQMMVVPQLISALSGGLLAVSLSFTVRWVVSIPRG